MTVDRFVDGVGAAANMNASLFLAFFGLVFAGLGLALILNVGGAADFYAKVQIMPWQRKPTYVRFAGAVFLVMGLVFTAGILLTAIH